ncbi:tyramine/octopamine receptor-like [Saccostrea cucullata]|uniref:tyramine/octopamine receptor-like n=1 Tax=Saccostrea cuccullata TaxID=36930 RepID=UPI002ED0DA6D
MTAAEEWRNITHIPYESLVTTYFIVECTIIGPIIVGNLLIIISLLRFHRLRKRIYVLVGNLAVSDLLIGLVFIPYDLVFLTHEDLARQKYFCLIRHSLVDMLLGASVMNLFAISLERYIAVVHPLHHAAICTWKSLSIVIAMCWLLSILLASLPLLGWNQWKENVPCDILWIWPKAFKSIMFIYFTTSLVVNFFMYIKVVRTAWSQFKICDKPIQRQEDRHRITSKSYRKTKIMILLLGAFAICWGPYLLIVIFDTLFLENNTTMMTLRKFLSIMGLVNSGLNWVIFGLKNAMFRKAFTYLLRCGVGVSEDSLAVSSSITPV